MLFFNQIPKLKQFIFRFYLYGKFRAKVGPIKKISGRAGPGHFSKSRAGPGGARFHYNFGAGPGCFRNLRAGPGYQNVKVNRAGPGGPSPTSESDPENTYK